MANVEITGESNVSGVVGADLAKARVALSDLEKGGSQAANGLNLAGAAMSVIGAAGTLAGVAAVTTQLYEMGAAAREAGATLDAMTGGRADAYINAVTIASDGMISKFDATTIANKALNAGFFTTSEQLSDVTNAATALADVMGMDTVQAENLLIDAIDKGNARLLAQVGIIQKGADNTAEINALVAAQPGLTNTQAAQLAAFNAVMERSNELQALGVGTQRSAGDSAERLTASINNLTTAFGGYASDGLQPAVDGATNLVQGVANVNDALAQQADRMTSQNMTWDEFRNNLMETDGLFGALGITTTDFQQRMAQGLAIWEATQQKVTLARVATMEFTSTNRDAAAGVTANAAAVADLLGQIEPLSTAINQYNQEVEQQASGVLNLLQNQNQLKDAWTAGQNAIAQGNLTANQALQIYQDLGLATGNLSQAQIIQAGTQQQLDNMLVGGALAADQYFQAVSNLKGGVDATMVSQQAQRDAMNNMAAEMIANGIPAMMAYASAQKDVENAASGHKTSEEDLTAMITSYNEALGQMNQPSLIQFRQQGGDQLLTLTGLISAGLTTMPTAHDIAFTDNAPVAQARVDNVTSALGKVPREINVMINIETSGSVPALPGGAATSVSGKAGGGPVSAGVPYIVGEKGWEVFIPSTSGTIIPNGGMSGGASISGMGGGPVINLYAYGVNDPVELVNMVEGEIVKRGKRFAAVN